MLNGGQCEGHRVGRARADLVFSLWQRLRWREWGRLVAKGGSLRTFWGEHGPLESLSSSHHPSSVSGRRDPERREAREVDSCRKQAEVGSDA